MAKISVDGVEYKVIETLAYQQAGCRAKFVKTPEGERVAVNKNGKWEWWTQKDRVSQPKSNYVGM